MDTLAIELMVIIANEFHGTYMLNFELVCKRWRDASRRRTLLISSKVLKLSQLKQYPFIIYLGFLELVKGDDLAATTITPTFVKGCVEPWIDMIIARPSILSSFLYSFDRIGFDGNRYTATSMIIVDKMTITIIDTNSDTDYSFLDRLLAKRPMKIHGLGRLK